MAVATEMAAVAVDVTVIVTVTEIVMAKEDATVNTTKKDKKNFKK